MSRRLYVWSPRGLVGIFSRMADGTVAFEYADSPSAEVISLSLPRGGGWNPDAPRLFLDGLLPDDNNERYRMKDSLGAASIEPFDLLDAIDTAGGYCYSSEPEMPDFGSPVLEPMSQEDIEAEIRRVSINPAFAWDIDRKTRFSLAGTQGKFTMVRLLGQWYRPSAALPSTHIVKPDARGLKCSSRIESCTMTLAQLCGIDVPRHGVIAAGGQEAYIVERFDREVSDDRLPRRLHIEDMTQALGVSRLEKYDVEAGDMANLLRCVDPTGELAYRWFEQFAFNVHVGNCDAHAKNYSLVLEGEAVRLSPAYDILNTLVWEQFDRSLAMTVNGKYYAREVGLDDWRSEADAAELDGDHVARRAAEISAAILDNVERAYDGLAPDLRAKALQTVRESNASMLSY